jgi:3-hydroxybutyryl-CoA dehydrogenase
MYDGFKTKYAPCPLLVNMVRAGKLGVKSGEAFMITKAKADKIRNNLYSLTIQKQ